MLTHIYSMDKATGAENICYCVQSGKVTTATGRFIPIWAWLQRGSKPLYDDQEVCKVCINSEKLGLEILGEHHDFQ